jgi:glycosyltransferase involved in cell wall biosynthesis
MNAKMLFISWISHSRRSQLIADQFGAKLYLVHSLKRRSYLAPLRYLLQAIKTWAILVREKPKVVFVQDPPIFAPLIVYLYASLWRANYIIDAHTTALLAPVWQWSMPLHGFLSRRAIATIVTNEYLENIVKNWGAKSFIIADIPGNFPQGQPYPLNGKFSVAVINTFAPDEPIGEVLKAASTLPEVQFYITGDPIRARKTFLQEHPHNVKFTGFLPDAEYLGLLRGVQAIMVLTTRDHTMQRGACEAVSLGKPIITSNWPLLRHYFNKGTVHVDNSCQGIRDGVVKMQSQRETLGKEILVLQQERRVEWVEKHRALSQLIQSSLEQ